MNLKEKIHELIANNLQLNDLLHPGNESELGRDETDVAAGMIEELVKELAAEFANTHLFTEYYTLEETKEIF